MSEQIDGLTSGRCCSCGRAPALATVMSISAAPASEKMFVAELEESLLVVQCSSGEWTCRLSPDMGSETKERSHQLRAHQDCSNWKVV